MMALLLAFLNGVGLTIIGLAFLYKHPDETEKWLSILFGFLSRFWKNLEYKAIKFDIQSRINLFVDTLNQQSITPFPKVSIKWAGREGEELIWEDERILLVIRDKKHPTKNYVHASYMFVTETLLRKSKIHLTKTQKISLDLFATKLILEKENPAALEYFMTHYLVPQLQTRDKISDLLKQYVCIQKVGLFFPILIQELVSLGNTVYLEKPNKEIKNEITDLINFLENFSNREVGDTSLPQSFSGKYIRCAIRVVASHHVLKTEKVEGRKNVLVSWIKAKHPNIYLVGGNTLENKSFMNKIIEAVQEEYPELKKEKTYTYEAEVNYPDGPKIVSDVLIHLHYPNAVKHIISNEELERFTLHNMSF